MSSKRQSRRYHGRRLTFADQVGRTRVVVAVLASKVGDEHGISTDRPLDAELLTFAQELRLLQTTVSNRAYMQTDDCMPTPAKLTVSDSMFYCTYYCNTGN